MWLLSGEGFCVTFKVYRFYKVDKCVSQDTMNTFGITFSRSLGNS